MYSAAVGRRGRRVQQQEANVPYLIRSALVILAVAAVWSCVWFNPDGVVFFVPGVGGWFFEYGGQ
jgi:hypothetical protein